MEVRETREPGEVEAALELRRVVFCDEQGVPLAADQDGRDGEAVHVVAYEGRVLVGTCRLLLEGELARLGRMAVVRELRGRGIGAAILRRGGGRGPPSGRHACDTARADGGRIAVRPRRIRAARRALRGGGHRAREDGEVPELRIDPVSGLRVIVAGEREDRPGAFLDVAERPPIDPERDPFAEGHEEKTPPEVYALRDDGSAPDGPGWRVRVVPNRYPALAGDHELADDPLASGQGEVDLFAKRPAAGAHEVVINAPDPVSSLLDLDPEQLDTAMRVWGERIAAHDEAAYVHVIVNEGTEAGASLPHTHAQLYALPFVPAAVARERERFTAYSNRTQGRNLLEDLVQEEVRRGERIVAIDDEAVAICPFAARVPFHVQVIPRRPAKRFGEGGPTGARLLHEVLARLRGVLRQVPPFNAWVRTVPRGAEYWCWHIELMPRLAQPAGLEVGAGVHLNVLPPERAAERLRQVE